jgi:chromate transporter
MESSAVPTRAAVPAPYSLWQLVLYFLKLGSLGFGGPVALVGFMQRDLVEVRRWIRDEDFKTGLALAQLAPGPLAAQLAIYLGYVHHGTLGATLAGIAFVLPSFLMVVAVGWAYLRYGGLPWMQAVFYGVGAAVIGIIAHSAYKLTRRQLGRDRLLWAIWLAVAVVTAVTERELISLILLAARVGFHPASGVHEEKKGKGGNEPWESGLPPSRVYATPARALPLLRFLSPSHAAPDTGSACRNRTPAR